MNNDIKKRFTHYPPTTPEKASHHQEVRDECHRLAQVLDGLPNGREKALALTKIEEAMFWANAAIARSGE